MGAFARLWIGWCEYPVYWWNEVRAVPAFALRDGINPYPRLGEGPLTTWIYGPVSIFVNFPATFAYTPLSAVQIGFVINALIVILPLAVIFFGSAELRARGRLACVFALSLSILLVSRFHFTLQVPDHTAIACGLLSFWCLARRSEPSGAQITIVAGLAVLAIWSKQIAVFLPAAHLGFLLLSGNHAAVRRYLVWFALFNVIAITGFIMMFGSANLWLNLVEIPGRLGWSDFASRLAFRKWALLGQVAPSVGLFFLWRLRRWPARDRESGRLFQLGALAYLAMLPIGLVAFFKVGGDTNLLHSWDYLMPACVLLWLGSDRPFSVSKVRLLVAAGFCLAICRSELATLPEWPFTQRFDFAAGLTARYPHAIWFPQNPLITYYADHRLWHTEDGVSTRYLAGYGVRKADFQRYLPPDLQAIAYPSVNTSPFSLPLLPEFSEETRIPYWMIYTRPSSNAHSTNPRHEPSNK